ncbi:MAG: hypothetical protein IPK83_11245 [Planctomycetes bacterium]|nr:hypothetical protein [Planctomycetota bacterium]
MNAALSHRCSVVLVLAFVPLIMNAATGRAHAASYPLSTFDRLRGVIVYDVHEDFKGGIWLGTESGVWRWRNNGFEMVNSPTGTTAQTPVPAGWGRGALTLASDSKSNTLWIGTGSSLLALNMESLEPYPVPSDLKSVTINRLRVMPQGDVWVGTRNGLYKLHTKDKHAKAVLVPETESLNVEDFVQAGQTLWVGTDQELLEITHGKIRKHFEKEVVGRAMHLHYASDGAMWMGLRKEPGLYRWDASGVRKFGQADGLKNDEVNSIAERDNGEIWIGTERGVFRWTDGAFHCIDQDSGLTQTDVHSIAIDRDDEIWIGTFGGGVCLLRSPDVVTYGPEDGLINPFVTVMCRTANDTILAGSLQGFSFFNFETETGRASEAIDHVTAAALDREGRIWLGGECVVLCLETGEKLNLPHAVKSIAFDTLGQMFIGCAHGLFVARNDGLRKIELSDSLELAANAILVESDNSLIVGAGDGVYVGMEGHWRKLPTDSPVLSLAQSSAGDLWVGTNRSLKLISKTTLEVIENYADLGRILHSPAIRWRDLVWH